MPTKNPRVNITFDEEHLALLSRFAEKENKTVSTAAKELILKALELEEDFYFSKRSEARLSKKEKAFSHESAWK